MKFPRSLLLLGAGAALTLAACEDDDGGVTIAGQDGAAIDVGATTATATATGGADGNAVTATPVPGATQATAPAGTPTPTGTPTPAPTSRPSSGPTGNTSGVPYSTTDVRAAMEAAGVGFEVDDESEPLCSDTAVPETAFRAGGSAWALWVYSDSAAREAEWVLEDGQLAAEVEDCVPPTGFNYFNANLVLALVEPGGAGSDDVRDAFLSLGSAAGSGAGHEEDDD
ncbi:MAG: hypothetical protein AB7F65_11365 [Dehalococcoidia bacterium]